MAKIQATGSKFGTYLRAQRAKAGMSLRSLASAIGISAPFLSLVERGIHGPLKPKYWPKLLRALPALKDAKLLSLYLNESKGGRSILTALGRSVSDGSGGVNARSEALRKALGPDNH